MAKNEAFDCFMGRSFWIWQRNISCNNDTHGAYDHNNARVLEGYDLVSKMMRPKYKCIIFYRDK